MCLLDNDSSADVAGGFSPYCLDDRAKLLHVVSISVSNSVAIMQVNVPFSFQAGDHIVIYPRNDPKVVKMVANHLHLALEKTFKINYIKDTVVSQSTRRIASTGNVFSVEFLLSDILDLNAPPSEHFLEVMGNLVTDEQDRDLLENAQESYHTIADILMQLKSLKISIPLLMEYIPKIKPRFYSIASSPQQDTSTVTLAGKINFATT